MITEIETVGTLLKSTPIGSSEVTKPAETNFINWVSSESNALNESLLHADDVAQRVALGEAIPTHEIMLALESAKLKLQVAVEVRNRLLESYQKIMQTQV